MFFGCAREGVTQEAQFECQTIFSENFTSSKHSSRLLLPVLVFGSKPVHGHAFHS
jgi:hypothetical protein